MKINLEYLRQELIGNQTYFNTPYGKRKITYADYTASGKTLGFIERYLMEIQKVYANTHTEDSYTGKTMTQLLHKAEHKIKELVGGNEHNYLIPIGTGSTGAIAKLCEILGLYLNPGLKYMLDQYLKQHHAIDERYNQEIIKEIFKNMSVTKPIIFVGPYEHHSNYLIWQESFAEVVEIDLNNQGEIDLHDLEMKLQDPNYHDRVKIGSFSAASNITGLKSNCFKIAEIMHRYNGLVFFDFAASAPYVEINMNLNDQCYFDAIFFSPHKFVGGPGSSGVLVIHKHLYNTIYSPTIAGGGTVNFVSPYTYEFNNDVEAREHAGTPGILQILKSSLALELKDLIGVNQIEQIENHYIRYTMNRLKEKSNLVILGPHDPDKRIAIISFNIQYQNKLLHHKFVAKLLNDLFGIQSRAGCACAGPYGHRLLGIDQETSYQIQKANQEGFGVLKPGFIRVNLHYLMTFEEVKFICDAIEFIADYGYLFLSQYAVDLKTGSWSHLYYEEQNPIVKQFGIIDSLDINKNMDHSNTRSESFMVYIKHAVETAKKILEFFNLFDHKLEQSRYESLRWFHLIHKKD